MRNLKKMVENQFKIKMDTVELGKISITIYSFFIVFITMGIFESILFYLFSHTYYLIKF